MNEATETHPAGASPPAAALSGDAEPARSVGEERSAATSLASPPLIETLLAPGEAIHRLDRLAVAGKLPGFEANADRRGFRIAVFAEPFDRRLEAQLREDASGRTVIRATVKTSLKIPLVYTVATLLAIWPGVALTDALIPASWGWIPTWQWYLPLLILPLPFALRGMVKRSNRAAREHLTEQMQRIATATEGTIRSSE